ncbi:MAG: polyphosphate polymerase domain-containing protein [Gammaproteobacteria bacterium]|nr:MAG: polyphosphate polymerase domain-containing protein [Gammaproteobacteria bacterium]
MNMAVLEPIEGFASHSLADQARVELMDRMDTKFLVTEAELSACLIGLDEHYTVLAQGDCRRFEYHTLYLDTPPRQFYLDHHNGKLNRTKVRFRHYLGTGQVFLEVKRRLKGMRTIKQRVPVTGLEIANGGVDTFLLEQAGQSVTRMLPTLFVDYRRVTLISRKGHERITLDTDLLFQSPDRLRRVSLHGQAVIEVKYQRKAGSSPMLDRLRDIGVRSTSFSKYCIGSALLFPEELKTNRFKSQLRSLNGICN